MKHTSEGPVEYASPVERRRHAAPIPLVDVLLVLGIIGMLIYGAVTA